MLGNVSCCLLPTGERRLRSSHFLCPAENFGSAPAVPRGMAFGKRREQHLGVLVWVLEKAFLAQLSDKEFIRFYGKLLMLSKVLNL